MDLTCILRLGETNIVLELDAVLIHLNALVQSQTKIVSAKNWFRFDPRQVFKQLVQLNHLMSGSTENYFVN